MKGDVLAAKQRSAEKICKTLDHQTDPRRSTVIAVHDDHYEIIEKTMLH